MSTRETPWPPGTPCWVDISVPDVEAALAFYRPVLGWTFQDTGPDFHGYRMCQVGGRDVAGIGPMLEAQHPVSWLVYLASDDVEATAKLIGEHGGGLIAGPIDVGEAGRLLVATDSTGGAFGVWQATGSVGTQVVDEPGSLVWEDARLTDVPEGRRFYTGVFGYDYGEVPGMPLDQYGTFGAPDRPWGGMGGLMGAPEGTPSHWLAYFTVADVDAAVAAVERAGGSVRQPAENTPFGRIGTVIDPFGAQFGLHGPTPEG